ncbi:DNA-processing protein DprA, partial [Clostridium perfringens]|uniref:DNA-processing protein DprA n=1 Tax=Clostridium perfringens TaxID=1502 RepID=UPI002ACE795F
MNSDELWFILANISNEKKVSLIEKYGDETTIKKYKDEIKEFKKVKIDLNTDERINEFRNYINSFGIGYITIKSKEYPESLRYITDPAYVLFYKGNIDLLNKRLAAVIGARKCTRVS